MVMNFSRPFFHRQQPQDRELHQIKHIPTPSQPQHARTSSDLSSAVRSTTTMSSDTWSPARKSKELEDLAEGLKTVLLDTGMNHHIHCLPESSTDTQVPNSEVAHDHAAYYHAVDQDATARTADANPIAITAPAKKKPMARYYSQALSAEDQHALAVGEQNHNLREWKPDDVLRFHDSRLELIHPGPEGQKEMIEKLMNEREKSEKVLASIKKRGRVSLFSFGTQTVGNAFGPSNANLRQAYQPTRNVRHSSAPATPFAGSPTSPPTSSQTSPQASPTISPQVSLSNEFWASTPALILTPPSGKIEYASEEEDAQAAQLPDRTEDYFAQPIAQPIARRPQTHQQHIRSSSANRVSAYICSPLNPQATPYRTPSHRPRPDVTFDSFLVPHASGKGEAFRGAENAVGYQAADGAGPPSGKGRKRLVKRVSKVASLPNMRSLVRRKTDASGRSEKT